MKKITSIILVLALAAGLTACSGENSSDISSSDFELSSDNSISSSFTNTESNVVSQSSQTSEAESAPENESSDTSLPEDCFIAPDGSMLSLSEASSSKIDPTNGRESWVYDFAFIRYAESKLYTTLDDPFLIDWESLKFKNKPLVEGTGWFKIKAGDKLENGLTVEYARYWVTKSYNDSIYTLYNSAGFEGEMTLSGVLYVEADEDVYPFPVGSILFFADPSENKVIPVTFDEGGIIVPSEYCNEKKGFAAISDRTMFWLREEIQPVDLSGVLTPGEYVKAKVTVDRLSVGDYTALDSRAVIISAERV